MRVYTDDELFRVDRTYLGPKGKRVPWRASYRAYGVWAAVTLAYGVVALSIFPITVLTVGLVLFASLYTTIKVMERLDADRPLATVPVVGWHELSAPRPTSAAQRRQVAVEVRAPRWPAGAAPEVRWWHRFTLRRHAPLQVDDVAEPEWVHPFARIGRDRNDRGTSNVALVVGGAFALVAGLVFQLSGAAQMVDDLTSIDADTSAHAAATNTPTQTSEKQLLGALDDVDVVDQRISQPGYDREVSFGTAWTDESAGAFGHNDCDTRNDLLARDLTDITYTPGTDRCDVASGRLDDLYTGRTILFDDDDPLEVQGDHVIPLAAAWDLAAWDWEQQDRVDFANDAANLIAVDGSANASKSDQTLAEWMTPDNPDGACDYALAYLKVAARWDIPLTAADAAAVRDQAPDCTDAREHSR